MTKKVLILSSSPRRDGNSDTLCGKAGEINHKPTMKEAYETGKKI